MEKEMMVKKYEELKNKYKVEHLMNDHKELIFILESPHVDELLNQSPVSGLSGKAMSKVIFGEEEKTPIGIKTKKEPTSKIGIMNICSIPMQRAAYVNEDVEKMYGSFDVERYTSFFDIVEKLRTGTKEKYKDSFRNDMQGVILTDFKNELNKLIDKKLVIIPCGKTAELFFKITSVKSDKWTIMHGVAHPSFGNWHKVKYQSKIEEVKKVIEKTN